MVCSIGDKESNGHMCCLKLLYMTRWDDMMGTERRCSHACADVLNHNRVNRKTERAEACGINITISRSCARIGPLW